MGKLKLSILTYSLAAGGTERVVSLLLEELENEFDIILVLMNRTKFYDIPSSVRVVYLEDSKKNESGLFKLIKLLYLPFKYSLICKKYNIDVSLSFMNRPNYINILANIFASTIKTIISERSMPSLHNKVGLNGKANMILMNKLYRYADLIIANAIGNRIDLVKNFSAHNVITINNLININKINIQSSKKLDIASNKFKFITVGRLDNSKNHQIILNSLIGIDAELYIIGSGPLFKRLQSKIMELELDKKVFLLGEKKNPFKYLSKSDCFILSSNNEGFPNVLLEALACGLPVISTDCQTGPREILSPKGNPLSQFNTNIELVDYGILTPVNNQKKLAEAMILMMENDELRKSYASKSKIRANDFSSKKLAAQYQSAICAE